VHAPASRPLLLLLDGHSTHYNPEFIRKAAHEQVIVFCFPPNCTHLAQPLDKGIFGPLKSHWNVECQKFISENPSKVITLYNFMGLFRKAWYQAMVIPNIISSFSTTGINPLNCSAIDIVDSSSDTSFDSLAEKTSLGVIPFYSTPCHLYESNIESSFTDGEHTRFTRRLEEGYDIVNDSRYNLWLKKYGSGTPRRSTQPKVTPPSNLLLGEVVPSKSIKQFLPKPPCIKPRSNDPIVKSAKVLTSAENRKKIEEKEKEKQEKLDEKERRKEQREQIQLRRKEEIERKKIEKEQREREKKKKRQTSSKKVQREEENYEQDDQVENGNAEELEDTEVPQQIQDSVIEKRSVEIKGNDKRKKKEIKSSM
jgi:hypothetical protein